MKNRTIGYILIAFAVIFGALETIYFGFNLLPGNFAELMCDAVSVMSLIIGINLISIKRDER